VRQDARAVLHHRGAVRAHGLAAGDVLVMNELGFPEEPVAQFLGRLAGLRTLGEDALHAIDRPEQVHGGRPRAGHQVAGLLEIDGELARALGRALADAERDAVRRGHADRRRAADDHGADRLGDLGGGAAAHVHFLGGQLALVHHDDGVVLEIDGRQHEWARDLSF
jgi:hypothetical protein